MFRKVHKKKKSNRRISKASTHIINWTLTINVHILEWILIKMVYICRSHKGEISYTKNQKGESLGTNKKGQESLRTKNVCTNIVIVDIYGI